MKLSIDTRRNLARATLACTASLAAGLLVPVCSTASQDGAGAEAQATRAQARAKREQERAVLAQEREALRTARKEERTAQRNARRAEHETPGEAHESLGETSGSPFSAEPSAQPSAKALHGCRLSIQASSERVTAGEPVTVSGTLTCPTGSSAIGRQITIYQHAKVGAAQSGTGSDGATGASSDTSASDDTGAGADSPSVTETATTQASGDFELTSVALYANTVFQARIGRHRARAVVKVAPLLTLTVSSPSSAPASATSAQAHAVTRTKMTFAGTVIPDVTGARVALQVAYPADGEHWRTVAFARVAAGGCYSIVHSFRIPGEMSVRAVLHAGKQNVTAISEAVSYEIPQPQNPQLTIEASADPVSVGQPMTISGVAAGAAEQQVTLLARTRDGAFAEVADSTTNATGDYTFTVEPLQNAYYRVTDTTEQSSTLLEGVEFAFSTATPPTTAATGQQLTFSGTLSGVPQGQPVYLERGYAPGVEFHVVAVATVGEASQYQIAYTFEHTGTELMRIKVPGDALHESSASAPFIVTVTH